MGCPRWLPTLHRAVLQQLLHDLLLLQAQSWVVPGPGPTSLPSPPPGDAGRGCFGTHGWVLRRCWVEERFPWGLRSGFFLASFPNLAFPGKPPRAKPLPAPHTKRLLLHPCRWLCPARPRPTGTHARGEAVGRGGLVDLVGMGLGVGAACRRLPLAPARGAAVHHAGLCHRLALLAGEGVALVRHHPGQRDKDMRRGRTTRLHPHPDSHSHPHSQTPLSIPTWAGSPRSPPAQGTALEAGCARGTPGLSPGNQSLEPPYPTPALGWPLPPRPVPTHPRLRRYHQAPSSRPPLQPRWLRVSQDRRFWGDRAGVMCPMEWMEMRSEATAGSEEGVQGAAAAPPGPAPLPSPATAGLVPVPTGHPIPSCPISPAVEKAQEPAQLPWSRGSWIIPGHFAAASKWRGSTSLESMFICGGRAEA